MWLVPRRTVRKQNVQHDPSGAKARPVTRRRRAVRLWPEVLEERALLSMNFTVTDTSDNPTDTGSLRYAVNNATSGSIITFANTVTGTITLTNGPLAITTNLEIEGPGANNLAISGNNSSGVIDVTGGSPVAPVTIVGLTLTSGSAANGAGVTNDGTLTLGYCTVANNHASSSGGGIWNTATMTLFDCTVDANNSAGTTGGGIENDGTMTATGSTVSGDSALNGGGIYNTGSLSASNCTIAGNSAQTKLGTSSGQGGGIANFGGPLTLTNSTVASNSAPSAGGGIFNNSGASTVLANTIVAQNTAAPANPGTASDIAGSVSAGSTYNLIGTGGSGGLVNGSNGNQVAVANPNLGGLAFNGGTTPTIALLPGSPAIDAGSDLVASNDSLSTDQRGFSRIVNGTVDIGAFEVQVFTAYSTADSGGGSLRNALQNADQAGGSVVIVTATGVIGLASTLPTLTQNVQILGPGANNLTVSGSDLYQVFTINTGATVAIAGMTIANGSVSGANGGGIANNGTLTLANCTVANNSATGVAGATSGNGGGIANMGTLNLTSCAVVNNTAIGVVGNAASGNGGGIANSGTMTLTNCTIADDSAVGRNGGGIANTGTMTMNDCTVAGNSAVAVGGAGGSGGGIGNSGSATLGNSIVAGNAATVGSPDILATITSLGYNLIGNTAGGGGFISTDLTNVNPVLGNLQNNGGPTPTIAVLPGSPAIGAGNVSLIPTGITTDQRGFPRTLNGKVDIGAFQSRGFTIAISSGNNQQVVVNYHVPALFPSPLVVQVSSPFGDPVQGGVVAFAGPSSGGPAIFANGTSLTTATIDASGLASVAVYGNRGAGSTTSYAVTAGANGTSPASVSFNLTNAPRVAAFAIGLESSNNKFVTGTTYTIVVVAVNASNQQVTGYRGSIQFISSQVATTPGYYTYVASDNGSHTFINGIVFGTTGTVYLTVYDTLTGVSGQVRVTVSADPPPAKTKAQSPHPAHKTPAARSKKQSHTALALDVGNPIKSKQIAASTATSSSHPAVALASRARAIAKVDDARERILAEVKGKLRAYLAAERFGSTRLD